MKTNAEKFKVGYVDEESKWVDMFATNMKPAFKVVSFKLTSDLTIDEIIKQIEEEELDRLVVDFELKEAEIVQFNGDDIIDKLRQKYPYFPVLIITSKEEHYVLDQVEDNDIVRLKDELVEKPDILIQRITNKIHSYHDRIKEAESTIEKLIDKRNSVGLSVAEESLITEMYMFLEKINPDEKVIPDNLIQPESITRLNEFVSDTKLILEELRKINN